MEIRPGCRENFDANFEKLVFNFEREDNMI